MRAVAISNPPNPWATTEVQYLEGEPPPDVRLEVYEDHTRRSCRATTARTSASTWSVNPYAAASTPVPTATRAPSHEIPELRRGHRLRRKILVKMQAPSCCARRSARRAWQNKSPRDRRLQRRDRTAISRSRRRTASPEGAWRRGVEAGNPAGVITKAPAHRARHRRAAGAGAGGLRARHRQRSASGTRSGARHRALRGDTAAAAAARWRTLAPRRDLGGRHRRADHIPPGLKTDARTCRGSSPTPVPRSGATPCACRLGQGRVPRSRSCAGIAALRARERCQ